MKKRPSNQNLAAWGSIGLALLALYLTSLYSFLLFHTLVELFSIIIAGAIFVLAWNFRQFYRDSFLTFIGTAFLYIGFIDLLHTLAYKGMGVFPGGDANLPTQLWIAARYLQSLSLLAAPLFLGRRVRLLWLGSGFNLLTGLLLLSIFVWPIFPVCYIEGVGLTPFKIISEYIINLILAASALVLVLQRRKIDRRVLRLLVLAIGCTIVSELAFTFYIDVYGFSNLVGHYFKIFASYLVYKAIIETEAGSIYTGMADLQTTERALRASEQTLKLFIEYAPAAIAMFDREMRYLQVSQRYLADYHLGQQDLVGRSHYAVFPDLPERWKQIYQRCLAGASEKSDADAFQRQDGSVDWVRWEIHPWYDMRGGIGGLVLFSEVITERKLAEEALKEAHAASNRYAEKLQQSNRELEQFAFIASHDLQEPLRKILMFGDAVERTLGSGLPEEAADYLARMQNAAGRMQKMIDGLLELSRVSTRGGDYEPVALTPLVREIIADLEARLQETGGQVLVDELPTVEADGLQMRQLFQNLIGNALKFHRHDMPPLVQVSTTCSERSNKPSLATVCVRDNGIGFDETYAEKIFQPFQRLHGRSEYEGSGLGLAICRKIVERHRGSLAVHSTPGAGSEFIITLPLRQVEAKTIPLKPHKNP